MQRKCNEAYTGNRMCLFCYLTGLQQNHWIVGKEAPRMKLKGKAAVITGASKGIGEGIAKVYAKYGAKCILAARGEQVLALAEKMRQEGYDVIGVRTDVSDYESVRQLARVVQETYGGADILVCNAGVCILEDFINDEDFRNRDRHFDININGVWNTVKAVLPGMADKGGGSIVIMSSVTGYMVADPGEIAYATSKAALIGFTPSYMSHIFKKITGMSLSDFTIEVKSDRAKVLLREKNMRIRDVAAAIGYANPEYFAKRFRDNTGYTPVQYRRLLEGKKKLRQTERSRWK